MGCRLWGRTESDTTERLSSSSSNRLTDLENELIGVGGRMGVKERTVAAAAKLLQSCPT